jgi:hypothetical protein
VRGVELSLCFIVLSRNVLFPLLLNIKRGSPVSSGIGPWP